MAAAKAGDDIESLELRREEVTLPSGGVAFVRALMLTERLRIRRQVARVVAGAANDEDALLEMIPRLLAIAVEKENGKPVMGVEKWDVYGSKYPEFVLDLFNKASELSGFNTEAAEKN